MNVSKKYFSLPCSIKKNQTHSSYKSMDKKKHVFNYKQFRQLSIPIYVEDFVNIVHVHEIVTGTTSFFIQLCNILFSMYINEI